MLIKEKYVAAKISNCNAFIDLTLHSLHYLHYSLAILHNFYCCCYLQCSDINYKKLECSARELYLAFFFRYACIIGFSLSVQSRIFPKDIIRDSRDQETNIIGKMYVTCSHICDKWINKTNSVKSTTHRSRKWYEDERFTQMFLR